MITQPLTEVISDATVIEKYAPNVRNSNLDVRNSRQMLEILIQMLGILVKC